MHTFNFRTTIDGRTFTTQVQGATVREALTILRGSLRDGETIVGW